jgi:hypothetical protein
VDKRGVLVDNSESAKKVIGEFSIEVPLNRNLSEKLFGQLKTLLEKKT